MTQATLFDSPRRSALDDLFADLDKDDGARWYQREAVDAFHRELETNRSTLAVMATGLGKTFCFSTFAREWDKGPILVLAHRDELITQAKESLERMVGDYVDIEQANEQSSFRSRYVVGSIQSVMQKKRLERLGHERFSLIIVDEAHHATAGSYRKVLDWFGPARVLGVTATPDRADEAALGQVFDSVAYVFDIEQGIDAGYLVPLRGRHVDVEAVDLSGVKTKAGDLADGDLDEVMVNAVSGIVHETLRLEPNRQAVAFFPGIRSAELAAQTFNEKRPGSACYVDGTTPKEQRRELLRDFRAGRYMYFCNCGIATEGFDAPSTAMIIHGRPTKSRALYAQMTGRGTRTLPGVIDPFTGRDGLLRRQAIAASGKPDCLLLDFVANSGKHDLVTPEDLLGGSYTDEEVALAKKKRKRGEGGDVKEELEKARSELKKLAAAAQAAKVKANVRDFDPFRALRIDMSDERRYAAFGSPMSAGQWNALEKLGVPEEDLRAMSRRGASKLLEEIGRRRKANLCSYKQARWLSKYGVDPTNVSFTRATEALDYIFAQRKLGTPVNGAALHSVVTRERLPGED